MREYDVLWHRCAECNRSSDVDDLCQNGRCWNCCVALCQHDNDDEEE